MERTPISHSAKEQEAELAWYCLRAQLKREHIAAAHLRRLDDVTVFCPRVRFKRATCQGIVWVTEAMFPGYLFARFDLATLFRQVCYTNGVKGIVRFADRYPRIDDHVVAHLMDHTGQAGVQELNYSLSKGDDVKIVGGAFVGLDAVVTQDLPAKERVKVLMDFLGRKIEAEVEHSSVLRYAVHPLAA
jgi:transcriptional antiterminator RfaH